MCMYYPLHATTLLGASKSPLQAINHDSIPIEQATINMIFRFGQQVYSRLPRPVSRLPNSIPLFVHSSQSNVDVGSAGIDGSLQLLDRLERRGKGEA